MGDHFKNLRLLALFAGLLVLTACAQEPFAVQTPLLEPLPAPADAKPSPIGFNKIRFAVRTGTPVIASRPRGLAGLIDCDPPFGVVQVSIRERSFPTDNYREIFFETLEGQGYDVAGDPGRMFDEEEDMMRAYYSVGGRITDVKLDVCQRRELSTDFLLNADYIQLLGAEGEGSITVEWTVFDLLNRRNVYKTTTQGYAALKNPNHDGMQLLIEESLAAAVNNLGADPQFHDLIFNGRIPEKTPGTVIDPEEEPLHIFDPRENVALPAVPLSSQRAQNRLEDIVKTAVMIEAGHSHGSGFFITGQGHIITNAHVVGNAARVRVVTSGKKEKMIAEVLRKDTHRDVALLRLEEIPDDLKIQTLPVRAQEPRVGEDVYAIGAPRRKQLQDTVTKGIISAHRIERRTGLPFIQADVDIYGGNSGGPLLDVNGNIIGLSVLGFLVSDETLGGLNWFIPIGDTLEKLDISAEKP